jgi:formate dehydrogenase iron-sulfur subunit
MKVNRRSFLKVAGVVGASSLATRPGAVAAAIRARPNPDDAPAVLVDTTRCIGCRSCEVACAEANGLPDPQGLGDGAVFEHLRTTGPDAYTVVNRYPNDDTGAETTFRKSQCMHCLEPACASACLVKALEKTPEGPVVYHEDRCIGCRYCMVACPFGMPKFEYSKALPFIRKCIFCAERQKEGELPACAEACPAEALQFGKRKELLEEARTRIYQNPDSYVHHIYGEQEAGGTSWLYIGAVPPERLGLSDEVGKTAYPLFTWPFLSAVPFVLTLWPPFLMGLYSFTKSREKAADDASGEKEGTHHE